MAVRIRMKKMGRTHRPFYRVCVMDQRSPRDGRVIEELGFYDTSVPETDARVRLKGERVDYWLGVGAQPSEKIAVLIKNKEYTPAPAAPKPKKKEEPKAEEAPAAEEAAAEEAAPA
ncbi:UNVERIFIED_CONTAM: hypothetical protein GTU68_025973, partial [Idotea baltica]|nr:hypothetical protein [Idotea baltica]